jgi:hypothetical protein
MNRVMKIYFLNRVMKIYFYKPVFYCPHPMD